MAKRSMARHTSSCVIFFLPMLKLEFYPFILAYIDFIPHLPLKQEVQFPRFYNKNTPKKNILKKILTKHLTNRFLYTIF